MLACQMPKKVKRPAVMIFPDGREICNMETNKGRAEYLYRTMQMRARQNVVCALCGCPLFSTDVTFDHEAGRGSGGGNRTDALIDAKGNWINAAVHLRCNIVKGSKRYKWQGNKYLPVTKFQEVA